MRYEYIFNNDKDDFEHRIEGHKEDSWNVDMLLAPLILHLLKEVKEEKPGTPLIFNKNVPVEIHFAAPVDGEWTDVEHEANSKQWQWIIDEMIFAFDFIVNDCEYSDEMEASKKEADRVRNGTTLFGKYFQNLWT